MTLFSLDSWWALMWTHEELRWRANKAVSESLSLQGLVIPLFVSLSASESKTQFTILLYYRDSFNFLFPKTGTTLLKNRIFKIMSAKSQKVISKQIHNTINNIVDSEIFFLIFNMNWLEQLYSLQWDISNTKFYSWINPGIPVMIISQISRSEEELVGFLIFLNFSSLYIFNRSVASPAHLSLLPQECIASRVLHMSPDGMQLLKPVAMEIPHLVALRNKERELVVMKYDGRHSKWREVVLNGMYSSSSSSSSCSRPERRLNFHNLYNKKKLHQQCNP